MLLILVRQFLLSRSGLDALLANALSLRRGGLLTLFWIVAVGVTLLSPRFLAGQIDVIPMAVRPGIGIEGLRPTIQNLSQLAYLTISTFAVFAFAKKCSSRRRFAWFLSGVLCWRPRSRLLPERWTTHRPIFPLRRFWRRFAPPNTLCW
ncbi:hypothetical protein ACFSKM_18350 [Ancylobacter dichloromethanicus]